MDDNLTGVEGLGRGHEVIQEGGGGRGRLQCWGGCMRRGGGGASEANGEWAALLDHPSWPKDPNKGGGGGSGVGRCSSSSTMKVRPCLL